jgi:hypothetical protein
LTKRTIRFEPGGPVAKAFMKSEAFVRAIRGPVGSGKSVCCAMELMRRAMSQKPGPDGKRKTRWAIVRNTFPELKTTTVKTWLDWFPEKDFGKFNWTPPFTHHIKKGDVDAEFIFFALDRDTDVSKLLSLELTGAWVNEAREIQKPIVDALTGRVGRYPAKKDGGWSWRGIIMDSNAMEPDHWWPLIAGDTPIPEEMDEQEALLLVKPTDWEFFNQPGAMIERIAEGRVVGYDENPNAENVQNHTNGFGYYQQQMQGKTRSYINVYILNKLGAVLEGQVIYPDFREERHVAREKLRVIPTLPLLIGVDFGLTPSAIIGQQLRGRWLIHKEICAQSMGAERFSKQLVDLLNQPPFAGLDVQGWGDPAGDQRAQTDETTPFEIFRANGLPLLPAPSNDPVLRIEAVTHCLNQRIGDDEGFLLDPSCMVLRAGFLRGYHYPKIQVSGGTRYADRPNKNRYSHPHDALQYLIIGSGGGRTVTRKGATLRPVVAPRTPAGSSIPSSALSRILRRA